MLFSELPVTSMIPEQDTVGEATDPGGRATESMYFSLHVFTELKIRLDLIKKGLSKTRAFLVGQVVSGPNLQCSQVNFCYFDHRILFKQNCNIFT